jgi:alkylated DNA repair dioxygenase AlkB
MTFISSQKESDHPHNATIQLWFGLSIEHRTLLEALQDDWLRPGEGRTGHLLGVRTFAFAEVDLPSASEHPIFVRLKFDAARLPQIPILCRGESEWVISSPDSKDMSGKLMFWPGALPTFAICELLVSNAEESARLNGIVRQVSNISLPVLPRIERSQEEAVIRGSMPPRHDLSGILLPSEMDKVRSAIAMALWALPRVDPWLDFLCRSLGPTSSSELARSAEYLQAPWGASLPWVEADPQESEATTQMRWWKVATSAFRRTSTDELGNAIGLLHQVSGESTQGSSEYFSNQLQSWTDQTMRILRGKERLDLSDWKENPVGKSIQLVLNRPDPTAFRKWKDDLPSLPPAVWWFAAILCGLLHGYRRLPTFLRGDVEQQRFLAIHALRVFGTLPDAKNWKLIADAKPEWRREGSEIVLSWSGTTFARKPEHARGKWFTADLTIPATKKAAETLSQSNHWTSTHTKITVPAGGRIPFAGDIKVIAQAPKVLLAESNVEIIFPSGSKSESLLDTKEFLRCIATEGADVFPPPEPLRGTAHQLDQQTSSERIPGLIYVPNFLSEAQEEQIVAAIDRGLWRSDLKRRVQHFGWRYDYKAREIDISMRLGPLPDWAMTLAKRLKAEGYLQDFADQVIVNEYIGKQGISRHTDCTPCFDDGIAMLSLLESWEMIFRDDRKGSNTKVPKLLERRSVTIMTGEARYRWTHEIPSRLTEPGGFQRGRRLSVTFRKVNDRAIVRERKDARKRSLGRP